LQIVPLTLLRRGHVRASSMIFVFSLLATTTFIAMDGQGIHDIALMAFPIIILFAGLTLQGNSFRFCVGLTLLSMAWLVFGESNGLFVSQPYETPQAVDFIDVAVILLVAAACVNLLSSNMRKNLERARQEIAQRKLMEVQLRYQGTHDALTGIYNRTFFEEELDRFERGREFPISVIVADVDKLKVVNDTRGHAAGDEVLRQATNVLRGVFRAGDVLARVGGDEFAILLPSTDPATADQIVSRVREQLSEHNIQLADMPVQMSLGAATADKSNLRGVFTVADQHMYADKSAHQSSAIHSLAV